MPAHVGAAASNALANAITQMGSPGRLRIAAMNLPPPSADFRAAFDRFVRLKARGAPP